MLFILATAAMFACAGDTPVEAQGDGIGIRLLVANADSARVEASWGYTDGAPPGIQSYEWDNRRDTLVVASGVTQLTVDTFTVARPAYGIRYDYLFRVFAVDSSGKRSEWTEQAWSLGAVDTIASPPPDTVVVDTLPADTTPPPSTTQPIPLIDMSDTIAYHGFLGGLYPGGSNTIPDAQAKRQPPIDESQRFALLSIGMSNVSEEFCNPGEGLAGPQACADFSFVGQASASASVNDSLVLVNGAQGSRVAVDWDQPNDETYDEADSRLALFGLAPADVQAIWLKQVNRGPDVSLPAGEADAYVLLRRLGDIMRAIKLRYPNVRQLYLSSRIWSCAAPGTTNPEPFAYESGFAVKWLIEAQIRQLATGTVDQRAGDLSLSVAPWLAWGPYLWADGRNPRSDGFFWLPRDLRGDCLHPSDSGIEKVGGLLYDFFSRSELTRTWFLQ